MVGKKLLNVRIEPRIITELDGITVSVLGRNEIVKRLQMFRILEGWRKLNDERPSFSLK